MSFLVVVNSLPWLFWVFLGADDAPGQGGGRGAGVGAETSIGWGAGGIQSALSWTRLLSGWVGCRLPVPKYGSVLAVVFGGAAAAG